VKYATVTGGQSVDR